jgi:hypothetical protein
MALKDVLVKLKLVEADSQVAGSAPAGVSARSAESIEEILRGVEPVPIERFERQGHAAPARSSGAAGVAEATQATEIPEFPEIYRAAGVGEPAHGFTAFKVLEILSSPDFADLPPKAKAAALGGFLKMNPGGPVALSSVIQDAVRRDQALDKFEEFLRGKLAERAGSLERENAKLQAEIDELARRHRERMAENRRQLEAGRARFEGWLERKRAEEERLHQAVAPFVEENPVSRHGPGGGA